MLLTGGIGACVLVTGGHGTSVRLMADTANAAACPAGTGCAITGTLGMTGGVQTLTAPGSLGWTEAVTGLDQQLADTLPADQTYQVNDSLGTGWHVTVSATTFTSGTHTLLDTGTFATNGSVASMAANAAPTATCLTGSTCTLPNDTSVTYPVPIITAATTPTAWTIYDATIGTGTGTITIGAPGAAAVGWWLNVPSNTIVGSYTSTVTLELLATP